VHGIYDNAKRDEAHAVRSSGPRDKMRLHIDRHRARPSRQFASRADRGDRDVGSRYGAIDRRWERPQELRRPSIVCRKPALCNDYLGGYDNIAGT